MSGELESLVTQLRRARVPYAQAVQAFRKQFICTLLVRHHGNQGEAAEALGIHRNTMKRMLKELRSIGTRFVGSRGHDPRDPC